jgi:hypothetical protein
VYRLFFIAVLPFRLRENSSFPWLSFSGADHWLQTELGRFVLEPEASRPWVARLVLVSAQQG